MPLTRAELEDAQASAMADDVEIDLERMSAWTLEEATTYFESGGAVEPAAAAGAKVSALVSFLRAHGLGRLEPCLSELTLEQLAQQHASLGRTALLGTLKRAGVVGLTDRQAVANALEKAVKAGALAAFSPYPPLPAASAYSPPRSMADFDAHQERCLPGDSYGLEFPFTAAMLADEERFGSRFLTEAFRSFGSISASNAVRLVACAEFVGGGAASKAVLEVEYTEPSDALHTRLFVKMPHGQARKREKYLCACILVQDAAEVTFAQRFVERVPMRAPRTYFADRSELSTNFILVSELLEFAPSSSQSRGEPARLPPYALHRAYSKQHDHHLGAGVRVAEFYEVMCAKLGQLAGWHKSDAALAAELHEAFPRFLLPSAVADPPNVLSAKCDALTEFVGAVAPQLFPPDVSSPAYLRDFREQFVHLMSFSSKIAARLSSDPDYVAFAHPNLNIDNAFWWRDERGGLDAGVIDWAAFGCREAGAALDMCLFACDHELMLSAQTSFLRAYASACRAAGGPTLDVDELKLRLDLTLALSMAGQTGIFGQIYQRVRKEAWSGVADRFDPRIDADDDAAFIVRAYAIGLVNRLTRFKRDRVYQTACAACGEAPRHL